MHAVRDKIKLFKRIITQHNIIDIYKSQIRYEIKIPIILRVNVRFSRRGARFLQLLINDR
jgi:hypothetical protein